MQNPTPDFEQRSRGLLLGLAAGNSLGLPWEKTWPRAEIARLSNGRIRDILEGEETQAWDDETAQAVLVAETWLAQRSLDLEDLGKRFVTWKNENGRGIGNLTTRVLDEIEGEVPVAEASKDAYERLGRNWSSGNGALARCLPLGLVLHRDPSAMIHETTVASQVTHWNPLCVWSAIALNLAIATLVRGETVALDELCKELKERGAPELVSESVRTSRTPLAVFDLDSKHKSHAVKTLQAGLWSLRATGTIEETLETLILAGGDTDTNASIAGALLGARDGIQALPERWIARLHQPERLQDLASLLAAKAR